MLKIGSITLSSDLMLAPLAGFSDVGFRRLCKLYDAGLTFTEMISMKGLKYSNARTVKMLVTDETEKPSAVQIFGNDPDIMSEMCASEHISRFDIVDINMGCPVPKIVNNGEGSSLMRDIKLAEKVITAVRKNVKTLTVKFRKGFDDKTVNAVEFARMCEGAGADAVTVHGRTREQYYSGNADINIISQVVGAVKIPVIGNGDVYINAGMTPEKMKRETGCAGVMIARGALGRPYVFSKEYQKFAAGEADSFQRPLVYNLIDAHMRTLLKIYPEELVVKHMRSHIAWYLKEIPGGKKLKSQINAMSTAAQILEAVKNI